MVSRVLLSVDTELSWRHRAAGADWRANFERSIEPAGVGIAYQLRMLGEHRLKACFFVDPMPALVYGIAPIEDMVAPILAAGQEVQLHLHPSWYGMARGHAKVAHDLVGMGLEDQKRLIGLARDLLVEAGAPPPTAFRAGSYAADDVTLSALAELGFVYDSSHNGSQRSHSRITLPDRQIAPLRFGGVTELPVTLVEAGRARLRHLQICALTAAEQVSALLHAAAAGHPLTTIVSHSFELATRSGLRPNRLVKRRFDRLCAFLDGNRDMLPTAHIEDLGDLPLGLDAQPMPAQPHRTVRRVAEQFWSGTRYERPVEAATATYGSSLQGAEMLLPLIGG